MQMNEATLALAKEAGREGAREALRALGVDIDDADEIRHFQANQAFVFRYRRMAEHIGTAIICAIVTIITGGLLSLIWAGIKSGTIKGP